MPTVITCTQHAECMLVDGVHTPGHPRAPDAPLVRDVEKAERAAISRLKEAGEKAHRIRFELAPLLEDVEKRVQEADHRVRDLAAGTKATMEQSLESATTKARTEANALQTDTTRHVRDTTTAISLVAQAETRRLTQQQRDFNKQITAAQQAISKATGEAVAVVQKAHEDMAAEYQAFTTAVDEERVRLATARHAFVEKANRASADLREEAKEVVRAAHDELKTLAALKDSLHATIKDLLRSAQDAKAAVRAFT